MAFPEEQDTWRRTTEFLRDARAHLSEVAEGIFTDEMADFETHLNHNELELALNSLEAAVCGSPFETLRVLDLLISAAECMGLEQHVVRYRMEIERVHRGTEERWREV